MHSLVAIGRPCPYIDHFGNIQAVWVRVRVYKNFRIRDVLETTNTSPKAYFYRLNMQVYAAIACFWWWISIPALSNLL